MTYAHIHTNKSLLASALLVIPLAVMLSSSAFADEIQLFSNEVREENGNALILDNDDTGGDVILQFGSALGKTLHWDSTNNYFNFNDNVNIQGDLSITGTVDGVDVSELETTVSGNTSEISSNDSDIATNVTSISGNTSDILDLQGAVLNNTGTNSSIFTLDQDDTGGNIFLEFGSSLGEALAWDAGNSRFDLSDDLNVQGDITLTGTVDGVDVSGLETTVSGNTSEITSNDSDIATNISNISGNASEISSNASDILALETLNSTAKLREYQVPLGSVVIRTDGTDNAVNIYRGTETGANPHEFNRAVSSQSTVQDIDLEFKIMIPSDFDSLGNISLDYKVEGASTLDIIVKNAGGNTLASSAGLNSSSWTTYTSALSGTVSSGEYIYVTGTVHTSNLDSVYFGDTIVGFNTTR